MKKRESAAAAIAAALLVAALGCASSLSAAETAAQKKPQASKSAKPKPKLPVMSTVQECHRYILNPKSKYRAEAAEMASALVEKGEGLAAWPEFLATLGKTKSAAVLPILLRYLSFPVAEIRLAAASGLADLARATPPVWKDQTGLNGIVSAASDDGDPRVRLESRRVLLFKGKDSVVSGLIESSPFVLEGYAAYKRNLVINPVENRKTGVKNKSKR